MLFPKTVLFDYRDWIKLLKYLLISHTEKPSFQSYQNVLNKMEYVYLSKNILTFEK